MSKLTDTFPYKRVVVTGGAGFLGRHIVERLGKFKGTEIFIPTRKEYDLVEPAYVKRLLSDTPPQLRRSSCSCISDL
jgi:GDP-L-fucose synthase